MSTRVEARSTAAASASAAGSSGSSLGRSAIFDDAARDGQAGREFEFAQRRAREVERIGQPRDRLEPRRRVVLPLAEGAGERDQVRGQVARVDRRYVARFERVQILRVVPVVQVAAEFLHARHRRQRRLDAIERVAQAAPAEVARRDDRQQIEPDVGGRGAVREHPLRIFLVIVGRQVIFVVADERLEKPPGAAPDQAQLALFLARQLGFRHGRRRAADAPRNHGSGQPQQQERQGDAR
jgi:hypothetical protein